MPYTIVKLGQGTPRWLMWRKQGIGASDAPVIMGESPWCKVRDLMEDKLEEACWAGDEDPDGPMGKGTRLEPLARKRFEAKVGVRVSPACLQSRRYDWLRASVDGLSIDGKVVLEIKCGEGAYSRCSKSGKVPKYYVGQLQHILAVTNLPIIDFFCHWPGNPDVHLRIPRDNDYIVRLLEAERLFWQEVVRIRARR